MENFDAIESAKPSLWAQLRRVRWRIIPGTFLAIYAVIGLVGTLFVAGAVVFFNVKYGWIPDDPANPTLSQLAITPKRVLAWQCACWGCVVAGFAANF